MAADGGYASIESLRDAKALKVKDVVFHKKRGLKVEDMAKSPWVYRKLRNFKAGIEAGISCLKRAYGLSRCTWKGLAHFKAYVVIDCCAQYSPIWTFKTDIAWLYIVQRDMDESPGLGLCSTQRKQRFT